jgi:predicted nuclease with TOPRIM domain
MNPYYYHGYVPQQTDQYTQYPYHAYNRQQDQHHIGPQLQRQPIEERVNQLERQNQQQVQELTRLNEEIIRLNGEIRRINEEIIRLNRNDELHTDRLTRLNQRLRTVERNLNIPYAGGEDGF